MLNENLTEASLAHETTACSTRAELPYPTLPPGGAGRTVSHGLERLRNLGRQDTELGRPGCGHRAWPGVSDTHALSIMHGRPHG